MGTFDESAACLAANAAQSTVATLLWVTWRSMARIVTPVVVVAAEKGRAPFPHVERLGTDKISCSKG